MSCGPDNYMELCRLCACYDAIKMEIFGEEGKERNLVDKIQTCLPFQVSESDNLPKSLCYRCMYNLENFYDFRKRSVNAVALLESCIGQAESRTEVVAELKEQFEQLHSRLRQIKKEGETREKDVPMPHLEPQFPVPMPSPEKRQTTGTEPKCNEALSPNSVHSDYHPPSDDDVIDLERDEDNGQDNSMDLEIVDDTIGGRKSTVKSARYSMGVGEEELANQETLHTCSICNKAFSSKGHLALHNKIHLKEGVEENHSKQPCHQTSSPVDKSVDLNWKSGYYRPYRCDLCNKSYSTAKHRWGHVSVCHRGNPLVTCPICARVFSTCYNLGEHKRTKHGLEEGEIVDINVGDVDDASVSVTDSPKHSISLMQRSVDNTDSYQVTADNFQSIQNATRKSLNNYDILHTCKQCLKVFRTEEELKRHSLCHTRRVSSDSSSQSSNPDVGRKHEFTKSFKTGKKPESAKGSETARKVDLKAIPGMNNETSLLKQTLLQSRECTEVKSRKRSPSLDISMDDVKIKKRVGSSAEMISNTGSRRKSSKPRKIARNEEGNEVFDEDQKDVNIYACDHCFQVFQTLSELQEHRNNHDFEEEVYGGGVNNTKPFTCILCEKDFTLRSTLSRHFNACHGIDPSDAMDISKYQRTPQKKQDACSLNVTGNSQSTPRKSDGQQKSVLSQKSNQNTVEDVIEIDDDDDDDDDTLPTEKPPETQSCFICEVCTREFGDRASLWLHLRYTHKDYAAYACGICLKICENNTHLYQHWKTSHPPDHNSTDQRRYCCQVCGRQHDCRKKLLTHVAVHNLDNGNGGVYDPEMLVILNTSFYKFENRDDDLVMNEYKPSLEQEVLADCSGGEYANARIVKDASSFGCELCYKSFPTEDGLVKHKKGAHKVNSNTDTDIPNSFRGSYQLYFVCELCGSSHRSKSERWRHVFRAHNGESTLTCDKQGCGKVFPTRSLKHEHCANHHRLQGTTPNVCEICGKLWGTRVDFWKHLMGVHSDCVPLTCGVCLKIFCNVLDLQTHVHTTHMPLTAGDFCCDICGRPYSNRSKLSRHRRIHLIDVHNDVPQVPLKKPCSLPINIPEKSRHGILFGVPSVGPSKKFVTAVNTVTKSMGKSIPVQSDTLSKPSKIPALSTEVKAPPPKPQPMLFCDVCPEMTFQSVTQLANHRRRIHSLHACDLCSKFYGRTSDLWKHVKRVHDNHPELTCNICKRISASKAHLENHISTKHCPKNSNPYTKVPLSSNLYFAAGKIVKIPTLYPCHKCSKRFWKSHLLKKHQRHCLRAAKPKPLKLVKLKSDSSASTQELTCDICSRTFQTPSRLKEHQKVAHAPQHCEVCLDVSFTSKSDLFAHIKENHDSHPNFCCLIPSCSRTMRSKSDLDLHNRQHKSVKYPPTCYLCGEVCLNKMRLWNHLNSAQHKASIPLTCGVCFKYFPSTEGLIQHVESFHPRALKAPDTCRICAKTYSSVYKVMSHFTKCHPEYFACKDCLQIFKSKAELQEHSEKGHVKAHELDGEGPIGDADEGGETERRKVIEISRKENTTNSLQDEDGIKNDNLLCEFCRETFPSSAELMEHTEAKHQSDVECLNSNSGAEEELSNIPEYDTEFNTLLKRPRRSYSCEKCSIAFRSPSDLADHKNLKHVSSVSDIKPYHCVQCDRHFTNKSSYWKHINSPAHLARRAQQKSITATLASQGSLMTGSQQSYSLNSHESTGNSCSAKAQNQGGLGPKVPFVYIPESSLQDSLIREGKTEVSCISDASTHGKGNDSKDKKNDNEGANLTLRSENVEYNGKHGLSLSQSNDASCNVKPSRRKSETRKVYSDGPDSKSPCYCQLCGKEWPTLRGLWQHLIRNHRREAAVTCGVCLDVCRDYLSLASHLSSHHPRNFTGEGNNFTCRICGRYHNARSKLIQHATIHIVLGVGPEHQPQSNLHNCQTCFRSFINEQNLHDHQKTHQSSNNVTDSVQSEKLQHRCEVCYKVCGNVGALMTHRRSHKVNEGDLFTTDEFVDMGTEEVEHHITSNRGSENEHFYSCDICLKVFKNESLYSEHKQTHVKSSKSKNIKVSHTKSQISKQNFYICDICTLVFATETSFAAHSESHNLSFPPTSPVSNARHSSANDLGQDIQGSITAEPQRLAAKNDTFPCPICQTTFLNLAILSTHFKVFHGKHFTCKHCKKKTFTSYVNLTKHLRICRLRKAQPRSLQGSIQLLKKWKERSFDNLVLSVDSQELSITKQSPIEIRDFNLLQENQNNESYCSIVGESEKVHTITSQHFDRATTIESTNDYFKNCVPHKSMTERNSVEETKESSATNAPLSISEYTDFIVDSELKQNEHRDGGSEMQERSLSKINPIDSGGSMPTSQNNKSLLIENFEQNEMDVFCDSATGQKTCNIFGGNVERSDSETGNSREDQFVCDAEINFRLEDEMTDYLIKTGNCLDVAMTKVSGAAPKHSEQLRELVSPGDPSEVPVMEEQAPDTSVTGQHSSVVSEFCDEIIGKYVIQNSPTCTDVLQELPIHVTGNIDKPNGNCPTGHGLGHDIMAEIVDNEILSEEACDFSESSVTSASGPLSASDGSGQKYVLSPLPVCKADIKKNRDYLYSLEDALDELVAQNTE